MMIPKIHINVTMHSIELAWTPPAFLPYRYAQHIVCYLWYERENPYLKERSIASAEVHSLLFSYLKPSSRCVITVHAVYNRASIDPGVSIRARTSPARKFKSILLD